MTISPAEDGTGAASPARFARAGITAAARSAVTSGAALAAPAADAGVLVRLLQLASPALPVGGFSYSQGLEAAIEAGWVRSTADAATWLRGLLAGTVGHAEARWLARLLRAWREDAGTAELARLDALYQASREGSQLLAETHQMAWSLLRLIETLPPALPGPRLAALLPGLRDLAADRSPAYPLVWSCLAVGMGIDDASALQAWLWSWLENQVMAAIKTVPLGQSAGQALLFELGAELAPLAAAAQRYAATLPPGHDPAHDPDDDGPGNFAPGFAHACTRHETQYSRLFRS